MNPYAYAVNVLDSHRWNHRLLLLFSPRADDSRVRALAEELEQNECELEDRDMIVGYLPSFGTARLGDEPLTQDEAARIRQEYGVDFGDFAVVLVGKDGFAKRREHHVPDLKAVFQQIDGMPMRRAEMRARGAGCER